MTVQFSGRRKAKINLPQDMPSLLQEINEYIEKASLNQLKKHVQEKAKLLNLAQSWIPKIT